LLVLWKPRAKSSLHVKGRR